MEKFFWLSWEAIPLCGDSCLGVIPSSWILFHVVCLEVLHNGSFSFTHPVISEVCLDLLKGNT